jgi:predicted GNAT family acetyltransferase
MELRVTLDVEEFARAAGGLVMERIETNVMASVLQQLCATDAYTQRNVFAYGTARGATVWAALRTPPWGMLAAPLPGAAAAAAMEQWTSVDPEVPWLASVTASARTLAAAWERQTGGHCERISEEAIHVLSDVVDPPHPVPGALRPVAPDERDLMVRWWDAFAAEAEPTPRGISSAPLVDGRISQGLVFVWDDGGEPVSMVCVNLPVAGVVRVGPVYTPPEHRRRGYAGGATAAVSRHVLAEGAERCMLYTDVTNATSNKIYAEVGYRRVAGWERYGLVAA